MPPSIDIFTLSDRTQTIRASVHDVQFTLLLTVALVVMVIFIFLRSLWATIIPSVAVPLALLGACALMWVAGYSLDNLSLMALTISVGFVVDDAIVMLENITRYIEEGEEPFAAALRGSREIAFTIVSISISLIAVLIPLLLMGGIIGRLFREFAVTLTMTIAVSAVVSLTLTPMLASRFLTAAKDAHHGRLYQLSERGFAALLKAYERGLDVSAQIPLRHADGFLRVSRTVDRPVRGDPERVLSATGHRADQRHFAGGAGRLVRPNGAAAGGARRDRSQGSGRRPRRDVDRRHRQRAQRRAALHHPKASRPAHGHGGSDHRAFGPATRQGRGRQIVHASRAGSDRRRTRLAHSISIHLAGSDSDALNAWAPKMLAKLQTLPELRDVATDQQTAGTTLTLTFDRDQAARYGLTAQTIDDTLFDAFGQRQIAQYFTQLSSYEVIMELLPSLQNDLTTLDRIFLKSPTTGGEVPLSEFAKWTTTPVQPLSISHQGQFPAITISFNLAPGVALGQATSAVQRAQSELQLPATIIASFQGNAQAFQDSLATVWMLIVAALVVVYLILGILYESYIHPITIISTLPSAGVGAIATLMLFHFDFSLIALIGIILLIGIVKKNGIMLIDFAMVAERDDHLSAHDAVRRAALLRFRPIMMTTMAAMLGGVPLMLGTGTGSELRQPLGYAIVGGLIVSQALTLFTTPVIYIYLDRVVGLVVGLAKAGVEADASSASGRTSRPGYGSARLVRLIAADRVVLRRRRRRVPRDQAGPNATTGAKPAPSWLRRQRPLNRMNDVRPAEGLLNEHGVRPERQVSQRVASGEDVGNKPAAQDLFDRRHAARFAEPDVDDHQIGVVSRRGGHRIGGVALYGAHDIAEILERFGQQPADHYVVLHNQDTQRLHRLTFLYTGPRPGRRSCNARCVAHFAATRD